MFFKKVNNFVPAFLLLGIYTNKSGIWVNRYVSRNGHCSIHCNREKKKKTGDKVNVYKEVLVI